MKQFFTKDTANQGRKLELSEPDGTPTKHWLLIASCDSDAFKKARLQLRREILDRVATNKDEKVNEEQERLKLLSISIVGWSLEEELNEKNKLELLTMAPQIADQIDEFVHNRRLFYRKDLAGSTTLQKPSSP